MMSGHTAQMPQKNFGRQLSVEEEGLAQTMQMLQQAARQKQVTQQMLMARQSARDQETLALQQAMLRPTTGADELMPPLEPTISSKLTATPPATPIIGIDTIPGFAVPGVRAPTLERPASDSFKSTLWPETGQSRGHFPDDPFRPASPPVPPRPTPGLTTPSPVVTCATMNPTSWPSVPPVVDACPAFTPPTYQHWESEVRLWPESYHAETTSQLLEKIISVLPQLSKLYGLAYMEQTGAEIESRTVQALMTLLDERYGKTDIERSWSWLTRIAEFSRSPNENLKDLRVRYLRTTTRLDNLGMSMSEEMMPPQSSTSARIIRVAITYCSIGVRNQGKRADICGTE